MDRAEHDTTAFLLRTLGLTHLNGLDGRHHSRIADQLASDNPEQVMAALEQLSTQLLMGREEALLTFPSSTVIPRLVAILESPPPYPEVPILAARVVTQLIDMAVPNVVSLLVNAGILDALHARFEDMAYIDIVEQAICILQRVAHEFPEPALRSGCPVQCLSFIDFFNQHIQRSILSICTSCCAAVSPDTMDNVRLMAPILEEHLSCANQSLTDLAISGMCMLIDAVARKAGDPSTEVRTLFGPRVANTLASRIAPGDPLLGKVLKSLCYLVKYSPQLVVEFISNGIPQAIAYAITKVKDVNDLQSFDSNEVVNILLRCPKDVLSPSIKLLGSLVPAPTQRWPFEEPYRTRTGAPAGTFTDISLNLLGTFAASTIQLSILIYSSCSDLPIRQNILQVVLQIISALPRKVLNEVKGKVDISSFVSLVISQADSISMTVGALDICYELVAKLPDAFMLDLAQKGVLVELQSLYDPDDAAISPNSAFTFASDLKPVCAFIAKNILDQYKLTNTPQVDYSHYTEVLSNLKQGHRNWPQVAELVQECSMLQLIRMNAFTIIADALINDQEGFLLAFTPQHVRGLVGKLEEAIGRTERFGVLSSSNGGIGSLVSALGRHVRLRLRDVNSNSSWPLNVQGILSIKNLEEFCQKRLVFFQFLGGDDNVFGALNGNHSDDENEDEDDFESDESNNDDNEDDDDDEDADEDVHMQDAHDGSDENDEDEDEDDNPLFRHGGALDERDRSLREALLNHHHSDNEDDDIDEDNEEENGQDGPVLVEVNDNDESDDSEGQNDLFPAFHRGLGANINRRPPLRFYYKGQMLHPDMSVIGAIYRSLPPAEGDSILPRSLWTDEFTITFEKTDKPYTESSGLMADKDVDVFYDTPKSLGDNPQLNSSIRLLAILHHINQENGLIKPSEFMNVRLTSKLNRQLEDPLIVVSSILPQWVVDTVRLYPFLYAFDSRYLFVKSTSFGYSRSMSRWQDEREDPATRATRTAIGRTVKQKYRISRSGLLTTALKVLEMSSKLPAIIEFEYYNEEGTGLGPTLEFYAQVSKEFQKPSTNMWRGEELDGYMHSPNGLFPAPMPRKRNKDVLRYFEGLGTFFARALMDQRIMDLRLNPAFFTLVLGKDHVNQRRLLELVDPDIAKHLFQLDPKTVERLELDFTLPGYDDIELLPGGQDQLVTGARLQEYIDLVCDLTVGSGVSRQVEAFRAGFANTIPFEALHAFLPVEFTILCGQAEEDWSIETLRHVIKADHGYTIDSLPVVQLLDIMSRFTLDKRRRFLQFMTGSPNLPIGGFKSLSPAFTIVSKPPEDENLKVDDYLPSVMTCANYLKLPAYSEQSIMEKQLWVAIDGGSGVFPLS